MAAGMVENGSSRYDARMHYYSPWLFGVNKKRCEFVIILCSPKRQRDMTRTFSSLQNKNTRYDF